MIAVILNCDNTACCTALKTVSWFKYRWI